MAQHAWVRRCDTCGTDDLRGWFGNPAVIADGPWWCPECRGERWRAACLSMPSTRTDGR